MLPDRRVHATLPVQDLDRARGFWEGVLGFVPVKVLSLGVIYRAADGTTFAAALSSGAPSGSHTQMAFTVPDLEAEVAELRRRGVVFEEYDLPRARTVDGIAPMGPHRGAWFRDPEGNLVGLMQFGEE